MPAFHPLAMRILKSMLMKSLISKKGSINRAVLFKAFNMKYRGGKSKVKPRNVSVRRGNVRHLRDNCGGEGSVSFLSLEICRIMSVCRLKIPCLVCVHAAILHITGIVKHKTVLGPLTPSWMVNGRPAKRAATRLP